MSDGDEARERGERFIEQMRAGVEVVPAWEAAVKATRGNVRRIMAALGYGEEETEEVVGSVVCRLDGGELLLSWQGPERLASYMAAVQAGDFERAELIMHAREG